MPIWPLSGGREGLSGVSGGRAARPTDNPVYYMSIVQYMRLYNSWDYIEQGNYDVVYPTVFVQCII
jgi:hypothetical protein